MQGQIALLAKEANGGVYQSVHGKHSHLWLLLIKHDIPLKSAVFHAGPGGTICTPYADDWQCHCPQHRVDTSDAELLKDAKEQ